MNKLRLAAAMAGGPVVVGRFDDGRLALRQADKGLTQVVVDGIRPRIIHSAVKIPWDTILADRRNLLEAVASAGYEVAPVEGNPLDYNYDKPSRVVAYEEAFGSYVGGTQETDGAQAVLGPIDGSIARAVTYFHEDQGTQVMAISATHAGWSNRGVMLWLRA